jgi:hypothetical protein
LNFRTISLLIALVLVYPSQAADTKPVIDASSPGMQDMMKWKSDFLAKYDEVIYLDADSKPVTEAIFFKRIVDEKISFGMKINSETPKRITLSLLSDAEQKASTAQATRLTSHFPANDLGHFLAERFDVATIRSSLGPRRSPTLRTFADFQMNPSKATDDVLEFDSADWFYQLRIVGRRDVNGDGIEDLEVCFTDQGRKGATYLSQEGLLITRYAANDYAVALNYSVDACTQAQGAGPVAMDGATADVPDYDRIGRFIYAFHRTGVSIDQLNSDEIARHAPAQLAARARRLAHKFDFIVKSQARVADAEIDATLREAASMSASIAKWRRSIGQ